MLAQDTDLTQEQAYSLLSKAECLFAALWHNPQEAATTEAIAKYYEVPIETIFELKHAYGDELENNQDIWTPRATLRLGMLLKSPRATEIRNLAIDVIEAHRCKDKRQQVSLLLQRGEFVRWSDREIARILQCSPTVVGRTRKELEALNKIVSFSKRKCTRGGNVIEQSSTKESVFQESSVHDGQMERSNPDSFVRQPVATVRKLGDSRDGEECVIVEESDRHWQKLVRFSDGEERAYTDAELDSPSVPYTPIDRTPTPRTYTEGELQAAIARAVQELQIGDRSRIREEVEREVREEVKAAQAIASQRSLENAKLQQKIDELESLRTLEAENQLLKQRIQDLENAIEERACQQWGNTFTKQAERVINAEVIKVAESVDPEMDLRQLATTPPPRHRYAEVIQLFEKAADLLDRVPLIGRRVFYQGRYGTIEDIEDDASEIGWDERRADDLGGDRYPLKTLTVLPTVEGIAEGSIVSWDAPNNGAYSAQGKVLEVHPRTSQAKVKWMNTSKVKLYPVSLLRLVRAKVATV